MKRSCQRQTQVLDLPVDDLVGAGAVRAQKHDLGPPDLLMRRVAISRERSQTATIGSLKGDRYSVRMRQTRTGRARQESHPGFKCQN